MHEQWTGADHFPARSTSDEAEEAMSRGERASVPHQATIAATGGGKTYQRH